MARGKGGTAGSRRKTKLVRSSNKLEQLKDRLSFLNAGPLLNIALSKGMLNNDLALFIKEEVDA